MKYETGQIEDIDLAWEMAHAEYPYRDLQQRALAFGLVAIAEQMNGHANHASYEVRKAYLVEHRKERLALLASEYETPIILERLFVDSSGFRGNGIVWGSLIKKLRQDENDEIPLTILEITEDEVAITGDLKTAAWGLRGTRAGAILKELDERFSSANNDI